MGDHTKSRSDKRKSPAEPRHTVLWKTDFNTPESADKAAAFERNILTFQADIANTILTGWINMIRMPKFSTIVLSHFKVWMNF